MAYLIVDAYTISFVQFSFPLLTQIQVRCVDPSNWHEQAPICSILGVNIATPASSSNHLLKLRVAYLYFQRNNNDAYQKPLNLDEFRKGLLPP